MVPTSVTPAGGTSQAVATVDSSDGTSDNSYTMENGFELSYYKANSDGTKGASVSEVKYPGKYLAVVTATSGNYEGSEIALPFTVKPADLGTLAVYEVNPDNATSAADTTIMYTGGSLDLGIAQGTTVLSSDDYTVKWYKGGSVASQATPLSSITDAGDYVALVTGTGIYAGQTAKQVNFKVLPFQLDGATATAPAAATGDVPPTSVTSLTASNGTKLADLSKVKLAVADDSVWAEGECSFVVVPATQGDKNFAMGTAASYTAPTVTIAKVQALATFKYGDGAFADTTIDASQVAKGKASAYDTSKITAYNGSEKLTTTGVPVVTIAKKEAVVDASPAADLAGSKPGTYTVTATVAAAYPWEVGGSQSVTVTVIAGKEDADKSLYVTYNGKNVTSITQTYDGTGIDLANISWTLAGTTATGNGTTAGQVVVKDAAGKTVAGTSLVNAGSYTMAINPTGYELTGDNILPITINKLDLTADNILVTNAVAGDAIVSTDLGTNQGPNGYEWFNTANGETTLPTNLWRVADKGATGTKKYGKTEYQQVTASLASLTWEIYDAETGKWNATTSIPQNYTGKVRAIVSPADKSAASNYVFSDAGESQTVVTLEALPCDAISFADVLPGSWYFQPVQAATSTPLKYMNGYAGTKLFGPNHTLTRGQAACILFNMAGTSNSIDIDEGAIVGDDTTGYQSFKDVDPKAYYAKAIAWGKAAGIVNGFAGTDNFGPDQTVTREQFAAMLWNYAKAVGSPTVDGIDVDAALASKKDGSNVSDWAKDGVAWAVANKVMGNGGVISPLAKVTRAEAAAMAVNYQPKPLM